MNDVLDDLGFGSFYTCDGEDCRDPKNGPFLIDLADEEGPRLLCYLCFATSVLNIDPDEVDIPR